MSDTPDNTNGTVLTRPHRKTPKPKLPLALRRKLAMMSLVAPEMTRLAVQQACDEHGVSVSSVIGTYAELRRATKRQTVAGEAETVEDNEIRLKANDALKDVLDRGAMMPPIQHREMAPRTEGGKIRMVQIDPDGTERILEVG